MTERVIYQNAREVVGLFQSAEDLQAAVDDLLTQAFDRADLSVLATEKTVTEVFGGAHFSAKELEDRLKVPTVAYESRESLGALEGFLVGGFIYVPAILGMTAIVATGGTFAAALAASAVGGGLGAAFGALAARILDRDYVRQMEEHLEQGGLLLWVATRDEAHERRAIAILRGHNASDAHAHDIPSLKGTP